MKLESDQCRRLFGLLPLIVFVIAAQGQAFGLQHCPLHDALPGSAPETARVAHHGDAGSTAAHDGEHTSTATHRGEAGSTHTHPDHTPSSAHDGTASGSHDHASGPGGCMECGIGSGLGTILGPGVEASIPSLHDHTGPIRRDPRVMGPRHLPFELHLPNAPPLSV